MIPESYGVERVPRSLVFVPQCFYGSKGHLVISKGAICFSLGNCQVSFSRDDFSKLISMIQEHPSLKVGLLVLYTLRAIIIERENYFRVSFLHYNRDRFWA